MLDRYYFLCEMLVQNLQVGMTGLSEINLLCALKIAMIML